MDSSKGGSSLARISIAVFVAALLLRLAWIPASGAPAAAESLTTWEFGQEAACTASSLLESGTLGDPWCKGTGASAWLVPAYPALVAACLRLGGGLGATAASLLFGVQAVLGALTAALLVPLGRILLDDARARIAAWVLAFHPLLLHYTTEVWDTTLSALAVVLVLLAATRCAGSPRSAFLAGLVLGGASLVNPICLALAPAVLLARNPPRSSAFLARAAGLALGAALVCAPWLLRNARLLDAPVLRTNFGVELRVGNGEGATGRHESGRHPSHSQVELERYRELGEVAYAAWSRDRALAWMSAHPARFLGVSLRRVLQFWLGEPPIWDSRAQAGLYAASDPRAWVKWLFHGTLGLVALIGLLRSRRAPGAPVLALVVLLYPLPYYVTHVSERYRLPIEPIVVLLAAGGLAAGRAGQRQEAHAARPRGAKLHP